MELEDWIYLIQECIKYESINKWKFATNSDNSLANEKPMNLPELYEMFHDWCVKFAPNYVPLTNLIIKGILKISYFRTLIYVSDVFAVNYPDNWYINNYFLPRNNKDSSRATYDSNLSALFERIVNAIKLFKEIYEN